MTKPENPERRGAAPLPPFRHYAGMGTEFAGALCGLTLFGYWIDHRYGSGLKATLICGSIGMIGGLYNFIRQALALSRETMAPGRDEDVEHSTNDRTRDDGDD